MTWVSYRDEDPSGARTARKMPLGPIKVSFISFQLPNGGRGWGGQSSPPHQRWHLRSWRDQIGRGTRRKQWQHFIRWLWPVGGRAISNINSTCQCKFPTENSEAEGVGGWTNLRSWVVSLLRSISTLRHISTKARRNGEVKWQATLSYLPSHQDGSVGEQSKQRLGSPPSPNIPSILQSGPFRVMAFRKYWHTLAHTHTYTHPRTNSGWHVHFKWSEMRPILLLNFPLFSLITVTHTAGVAMAGACLDGSSITRKRHIDKTLALPPYLCSYASPNGGERWNNSNQPISRMNYKPNISRAEFFFLIQI